jgi:hypothetical protein
LIYFRHQKAGGFTLGLETNAVQALSFDQLVTRIKSEYIEMPGGSPTTPSDGCRLQIRHSTIVVQCRR